MTKSCFKAYDIRGETPSPLSPQFAFNLGRGLASYLKPSCIVVGYDVRTSSLSLANNLIDALIKHGVNVVNIGLCGTEEVYFSTCSHQADGGVMITASHNPAHHNGFKLVQKNATPLYQERGFEDLYHIMSHSSYLPFADEQGTEHHAFDKSSYINYLLSIVPPSSFKPMTIVTNAGNGSAGPIIDHLEKILPLHFIKIQHTPDGSFPNGVPNPLLPHMRDKTAQAILDHQADLGIAWDGDFDRCFFYNSKGNFIHNHYIIGLLSQVILSTSPLCPAIVTDTRLLYYLRDCIETNHAPHYLSRSGHAFMKDSMKQYNAIYGGESSGHHYFRDFFYCDSGMLPWLFLVSFLSKNNETLDTITNRAQNKYPCSEEINMKVTNYQEIESTLLQHFKNTYHSIERLDGLSLTFASWRFNIRPSQTENLIRLNIESNKHQENIHDRMEQIKNIIAPFLI